MFQVEKIDHVALFVSDMQRSEAWYKEVLGLERQYEKVWDDHVIVLGRGDTYVALCPTKSPKPNPIPEDAVVHNSIGMYHLCFKADDDNYKLAHEYLKAKNMEFTEEDHDISRSLYFFDPDGYQIEIMHYWSK